MQLTRPRGGGRTRRRRLAALIALACAAACAGSPVPADRFYRIELAHAEDSGDARGRLDGALEVDALRSNALTSERAILFVEADRPNRVQPHPYDYWVEAPGTMLQQELVERLRADAVATRVATPEMRVPARYRLQGRINRFEQRLGAEAPVVLVELRLEVIETETRRLHLSRTYRATARARSDRVEDSIEAFDHAVGEIYERFVADLAAP